MASRRFRNRQYFATTPLPHEILDNNNYLLRFYLLLLLFYYQWSNDVVVVVYKISVALGIGTNIYERHHRERKGAVQGYQAHP